MFGFPNRYTLVLVHIYDYLISYYFTQLKWVGFMTCIHQCCNFSKHRDLEFCFFLTVTKECQGFVFDGPFREKYFNSRYDADITTQEVRKLFYLLDIHNHRSFNTVVKDWLLEVKFYNFKVPEPINNILLKHYYPYAHEFTKN